MDSSQRGGIRVTAVVLAGGRASRMGGADKGLIPFAGETLAARAVRRISRSVDRVLVSANRNLDAYAKLRVPVVPDVLDGFLGPLAGVHAAMVSLGADEGMQAVFTLPCDCPFFPEDCADRLREALEAHPEASCAVACADGLRQPTFALYRLGLKGAIEEFLKSDGRRIGQFLREHGAIEVGFEDLSAFDNLNTPQELEDAQNKKESLKNSA